MNHRFYKTAFLVFLPVFLTGFFPMPSLAEEEAEMVDRIVAIVNDEVITHSELMERLTPIYVQYRSVYQGQELALKTGEARRDLLGQLIEDRLVLQEARARGLSASPEEVEARIGEVRDKFESEEEFLQAIKEQGLTIEDLKEKYADQGLIYELVGMEVRSRIIITPKELQAYYASHQDEFRTPERVRVKMLLIKKVEAGAVPPETEESVERSAPDPSSQKAQEVSTLMGEALFEDIVRIYSDGPNREGGGDLGFIERGEMVDEIDKILFSTKVGEVAGPIETRMGYHFFKIEARQEESLIDFEDAHDKIENLLYQEAFTKQFRKWMDGLKEDAFISLK